MVDQLRISAERLARAVFRRGLGASVLCFLVGCSTNGNTGHGAVSGGTGSGGVSVATGGALATGGASSGNGGSGLGGAPGGGAAGATTSGGAPTPSAGSGGTAGMSGAAGAPSSGGASTSAGGADAGNTGAGNGNTGGANAGAGNTSTGGANAGNASTGGASAGAGGAAAGAGGRGGAGGANAGAGGGATGPIVLSPDGGYCWFESPRALFMGGKLVVGTVASGWSVAARKGDIEVIVHDLATGTTSNAELHNQLELDDHDSPALLVRTDGRLLAMYAKHGSENRFYYRLSNGTDPLSWAAEQTFTPSASTQLTYSNLFLLPAENNRIYDFYRGLDASYKPSYAYSDDQGATWKSGNIVINVPSTQLHRPYARYASNGTDTIHLTYTEAHPRDFDNSLYHVYYKGGQLYRSNGTLIRALAQGLSSPDEGTRIFQGDSQHVAWTVDMALDESGRPHLVYSVQLDSAGLPTGQGGTDIRYRYARWDGSAWRDYPLAYAGTRLYSGEDDYSGLAALDPTKSSVIYISTNADPVTGAALTSSADSRRHYELFRGTTSNQGATWQWTPLTSNSSLDNLRPILVTDGAGQKALVWLRGTYRTYTDYQQQVMALLWRE